MNDAFYKKFISNADVLANHFALNATMTLGPHKVCTSYQSEYVFTSKEHWQGLLKPVEEINLGKKISFVVLPL